MRRLAPLLLAAVAVLGACGKKAETGAAAPATAPASLEATNTSASAPAETAGAPAAAPVVGFDPGSAPMGRAPSEKWPYFGLMDGYVRGTPVNSPTSDAVKYFSDTPFDHYEFFDGSKLITVEGRLFATWAQGKGASFFQVQKTYEKLVHDLGGVTVYEGSHQALVDKKLKYAEPRFRGRYTAEDNKLGVYMVRTPASEIWVEVYHPAEDSGQNYWLTVVERKTLEVKVQAIPADEMKKALDATGHVALYINFDTDKTTIKPDSAPIVAEMVKLMTDNSQLQLEVQGHTDGVGSPAHNQTLSEGRAAAVVAALTAKGVAASRLTAKGYGAGKPLADNGSEDGRAKNRRVELLKR